MKAEGCKFRPWRGSLEQDLRVLFPDTSFIGWTKFCWFWFTRPNCGFPNKQGFDICIDKSWFTLCRHICPFEKPMFWLNCWGRFDKLGPNICPWLTFSGMLPKFPCTGNIWPSWGKPRWLLCAIRRGLEAFMKLFWFINGAVAGILELLKGNGTWGFIIPVWGCIGTEFCNILGLKACWIIKKIY